MLNLRAGKARWATYGNGGVGDPVTCGVVQAVLLGMAEGAAAEL